MRRASVAEDEGDGWGTIDDRPVVHRFVADSRTGLRFGGGRDAFFAGAGGRACLGNVDVVFFEDGLLDRFDEGVGARFEVGGDGFLRDGSVGVVLDDGGTHEGNSSDDEGDEPDFMQFHGVDFGSIVYLLVKWGKYHNTQQKTFSICKNKEPNP